PTTPPTASPGASGAPTPPEPSASPAASARGPPPSTDGGGTSTAPSEGSRSRGSAGKAAPRALRPTASTRPSAFQPRWPSFRSADRRRAGGDIELRATATGDEAGAESSESAPKLACRRPEQSGSSFRHF